MKKLSIIFGIWIVVWGLAACAPSASDAMPEGGVGEVAFTPTATVESEMQATLPTVTPDPFESPASPEETTASVPSTESAAALETPAPEAAVREHTVQPGETLLGLALAYDVPIAAIQLQNDLGEGTTVQAGQSLAVPPPVGWEGASPFWIVHEVGEGETLSEIAAGYGLGISALQGVNGLTDADFLAVGQSLILPLDAPKEIVASEHAPTPTPLPPPTATPVPTLAPTAAATSPPENGEGSDEETPTPTAPVPAPTEAPAEPPPGDDMAALAAETFHLINVERAAHGLGPLSYNVTLARAAQLHAEDCYERGWCGHTGSDGSSMKERIIRAGYDPARWSECWAWHRTPAKAVFAWMDEVPPNDPHRRTLLSTWLTEVGVGVMPGNGHGYYFIADFGKPR